MKNMLLGIILVLLVAVVVIQLIPVDRSNPVVADDMPTSPRSQEEEILLTTAR